MSGLFDTPRVWQNLIASWPSVVMTHVAKAVSNFLASSFVLVDSLLSTEAYLLTSKVSGLGVVALVTVAAGVVVVVVVEDE